MLSKLWAFVLAASGATLIWLDRPVGLRASGSSRFGSWAADGWQMGSPMLTVLGIFLIAVAVIAALQRPFDSRKAPRFRFPELPEDPGREREENHDRAAAGVSSPRCRSESDERTR